MSEALLTLRDLCFGYPGRGTFLGPISLKIGRGECWAIVGPNGAGKSTLLRLMAGLRGVGGMLRPTTGEVLLNGESLTRISVRRRARAISLLPQHPRSDTDLTARQTVLLGRFPHRSLGLFESPEDHLLAERAMRLTGAIDFAERPLRTLSGGEAQRVHLAAALAQGPTLLLLDEPTASLDLRHQLTTLHILRDLVHRDGLTAVFVTHDINLAGRFASRVLVLHEGQGVACGDPDRALTPTTLEPVFGVRLIPTMTSDERRERWLVPRLFSEESPACPR